MNRRTGQKRRNEFLGFEAPENLNMAKLPGFKNVTDTVKMRPKTDKKALEELHRHIATSPVGVTLSRPVAIKATLEA